jgi:hypothetical protein
VATDLAESVAQVFRSYRDTDVSCFEATVFPGGLGSDIARQACDSKSIIIFMPLRRFAPLRFGRLTLTANSGLKLPRDARAGIKHICALGKRIFSKGKPHVPR